MAWIIASSVDHETFWTENGGWSDWLYQAKEFKTGSEAQKFIDDNNLDAIVTNDLRTLGSCGKGHP